MPSLRKLSREEIERLAQTEHQADEQPSEVVARGPSAERYPHLAAWVLERGWVELGSDDSFRSSTVRLLDEGGMIWESDQNYDSFDAMLAAADHALADLEASGDL